MKKATICLLTFLLLLCGCAKTEEPENPYRLKFYTSESTISGNLTHDIRCEYFYDEHGFVYQLDSYWHGDLLRSESPERDEYGNTICNTITNSDGSQTVEEHTLTLDKQHRILRDEVYVDGICQSIWEYAYDEDGNQTMLNIIRNPESKESSITSWVDMRYDRNGNLLREDVRWSHSSSSYTEYSYKEGRLDKTSSYDENNKLTGYTQYSYDETGLIVTLTTYTADGTLEETVVNTYDVYGNLLTNESRNDILDRSGKYVYTYELINPEDAA